MQHGNSVTQTGQFQLCPSVAAFLGVGEQFV